MGSGKGAPAPPDFNKAATPTQNTPWATSSWTQGPSQGGHWSGDDGSGFPGGNNDRHWIADPGPMTQNIGLNPGLDQANQGMMNQLGSAWSTPLSNGSDARTAASNAIYGQETSRLDPQWQQRQQQFNTQLTNQGIDPNSAAGQQAYGNFNRGQNDAYQQANYAAVQGGAQAAQQQQQLDMNSRAAPLAGMAGLQGLAGMPQNPLLSAAMAQYQGALQTYGIQQQGKNSTTSALANLGGDAAIAYKMSDERVKEDVRRHPTIEQLPRVPWATWRYRDDPSRKYAGVIAQDLEREGYGHLVKEVGGVKMVDTSDARVRPVEVGDDDDA